MFCGVPQGSILGPLLFLLHFNDAPKQLKNCKIKMYADDTVIYFHSKDFRTIEKNLTENFILLSNWLEKNELILNVEKGKTEVMLFGTKQKLCKVEDDLNITHRFEKLNNTKSYKYLGVKLDPSLNFIDHFDFVYRKASGRVRYLKKIRHNLTNRATLQIFQSLIVPILTYCSLLNYSLQLHRKNLLKYLEFRALNLLSNRSHKVPSIENLNKRKSCIFVHKCIQGRMNNFENYFDIIQHNINTRNNSTLIRLPRVKLQSTKRAFFFQGGLEFNKLPVNIRRINDTKIFCNEVKKFLS